MNPTILTCEGDYFNFAHPRKSPISLSAIAHALSHICRFTGHTVTFYSVAEHSVHVSRLVPPEHALDALLHDAAEAFLGDVSAPLKALLPEYKVIEARVDAEIRRRFGLPEQHPPCVKQADMQMLATEQRYLMPAHDDEWACLAGIEPGDGSQLRGWIPEEARAQFMARFDELQGQQHPDAAALKCSFIAPELKISRELVALRKLSTLAVRALDEAYSVLHDVDLDGLEDVGADRDLLPRLAAVSQHLFHTLHPRRARIEQIPGFRPEQPR